MHGMHSGSVPTSMLAVFKLVKTLIICKHVWNALYMCCTSISETESSSKHTRAKLWHKKYALAHVHITVMLLKSCMECILVVFLHRCLAVFKLVKTLIVCKHVCNAIYKGMYIDF